MIVDETNQFLRSTTHEGTKKTNRWRQKQITHNKYV